MKTKKLNLETEIRERQPETKSYLLSLVILSLVILSLASCDNPTSSDNGNLYPVPNIESLNVVGKDRSLEVRFTKINENAVTGYEAYYGTTNSFNAAKKWTKLTPQPESQGVSIPITGLNNYVVYYVWVRVAYVDGYSNPCEAGSAKPRPIPASSPVFTTYSDEEAIGITWTIPVTDADRYVVYCDISPIADAPSSDSSDTLIRKEITAEDTCDVMALIKDLANDTTYYIRMSSINTTGETALSTQQTQTPNINTTKPNTPGAPTRVVSGNKSLMVQWLPVRYAKSYNIYYDTLKTVTTTSSAHISAESGGGKLSAKILDLENEKTYYVCISAVNGSEESQLSESDNNTPHSKAALNMNNANMKIGIAEEAFMDSSAEHSDRLSRKEETTIGDLTGDSMIYWARKHKAEYGYDDVDFAFFNGGVIQHGIPAGTITVGYMKTVYYPDNMTILTMTGANVRKMFKERVATVPHPGGGSKGTGAFGQVSADVNFTLNYNNTKSEGSIEELKIKINDEWQYLIKDKSDVSEHDNTLYRIITSTYLVDAGDDGYAPFFIATNRKDTDKLIAESVCDYIYDQDNLPIVPYTDGRLTLLNAIWQTN